MNLQIENEKLYLKVVKDNTGKYVVLKSLMISGGKNLDKTFKPSGYISVRLVKEAQEHFKKSIEALGCTIETYPKEIKIEKATGFLTYEKWDKGERFVAVVNEAVFTTTKDEKDIAQALPL